MNEEGIAEDVYETQIFAIAVPALNRINGVEYNLYQEIRSRIEGEYRRQVCTQVGLLLNAI